MEAVRRKSRLPETDYPKARLVQVVLISHLKCCHLLNPCHFCAGVNGFYVYQCRSLQGSGFFEVEGHDFCNPGDDSIPYHALSRGRDSVGHGWNNLFYQVLETFWHWALKIKTLHFTITLYKCTKRTRFALYNVATKDNGSKASADFFSFLTANSCEWRGERRLLARRMASIGKAKYEHAYININSAVAIRLASRTRVDSGFSGASFLIYTARVCEHKRNNGLLARTNG